MPFKKNDNRINRAGRPLGAKNKVSEKLRENITDFLESNFKQVEKDFKNLSPSVRFKYYIELLSFAVPKLSSMQVQGEFEKLTDEDLDKIINNLKKSANEKNG